MDRREAVTAGATGRVGGRVLIDLIDHHGAERTLDYLVVREGALPSDAALAAAVDPKDVLEAHDAEV